MIRKLAPAVGVLALVLAVLVPPASADEILMVAAGTPGSPAIRWVDPADPTEYMDVWHVTKEGQYAPVEVDISWRGTSSLGGGLPASIDFDGFTLDTVPCTGERNVPGCMYGYFTHDHMNTASFYMVARGFQYATTSGQISGAFKVGISWTGTGTVIKTINPDGTVTRTRDAVIDLWASFKGVVLVDVTGLTGSFPSVTRDSL